MKVAYLVGGLPFGGVERWLYDLSLEYMKNGLIEGRVFNLSGTGVLLPEYRKAGIDVECVLNDDIRGIASHRLDTMWKLRGRLKAFAPNLIHTAHFAANHHGRLASLGLGLPVVTHLRNTRREKKFVRRASDKLLSYVTSMYLAVSGAVAEVVQVDHNLAGRPVRVLYNALEPERLRFQPFDVRAEYGLSGSIIVAVSRYVPQKNLDLLIRAVAILRERGLTVGLVLVGEGSERQALETLREELGLEKQVFLTGMRSDVPAFYNAADVFAMPSAFEGFSIAHLEAMHFGLPAVVSRYVPTLEIAAEASLVCECEPVDIAEKLGRILQDEELRRRLSAEARRAAEPHIMESHARLLYEIYKDVLAGGKISALGERG
jgi:glycosyltransferase involved in cell wall biosynthesis